MDIDKDPKWKEGMKDLVVKNKDPKWMEGRMGLDVEYKDLEWMEVRNEWEYGYKVLWNWNMEDGNIWVWMEEFWSWKKWNAYKHLETLFLQWDAYNF